MSYKMSNAELLKSTIYSNENEETGAECGEWYEYEDDLQLAAELGKSLLARNKILEEELCGQQQVNEEQILEVEFLTKQVEALRDLNESRLKVYEQLETNAAEVEKRYRALKSQSRQDKEHIRHLHENAEKLERQNEFLCKRVEHLETSYRHMLVQRCGTAENGVDGEGRSVGSEVKRKSRKGRKRHFRGREERKWDEEFRVMGRRSRSLEEGKSEEDESEVEEEDKMSREDNGDELERLKEALQSVRLQRGNERQQRYDLEAELDHITEKNILLREENERFRNVMRGGDGKEVVLAPASGGEVRPGGGGEVDEGVSGSLSGSLAGSRESLAVSERCEGGDTPLPGAEINLLAEIRTHYQEVMEKYERYEELVRCCEDEMGDDDEMVDEVDELGEEKKREKPRCIYCNKRLICVRCRAQSSSVVSSTCSSQAPSPPLTTTPHTVNTTSHPVNTTSHPVNTTQTNASTESPVSIVTEAPDPSATLLPINTPQVKLKEPENVVQEGEEGVKEGMGLKEEDILGAVRPMSLPLVEVGVGDESVLEYDDQLATPLVDCGRGIVGSRSMDLLYRGEVMERGVQTDRRKVRVMMGNNALPTVNDEQENVEVQQQGEYRKLFQEIYDTLQKSKENDVTKKPTGKRSKRNRKRHNQFKKDVAWFVHTL